MAVVGDKENNVFIYIHGNFSTFKDFNILSNSFIKSKNGDFKRNNESFFEIPYLHIQTCVSWLTWSWIMSKHCPMYQNYIITKHHFNLILILTFEKYLLENKYLSIFYFKNTHSIS